MTIEVLAYNNHNLDVDGIMTIAGVFGNCILTKKLNDNDNFFFFAENEEMPAFVEDEELYISYLNADVRHIKVKDQLVPVIHDPQHYRAKGITFEYPGKIVNYEFLRGANSGVLGCILGDAGRDS